MTARVDNYADIDSEITALAYTGSSAQSGIIVPVSGSTNYIPRIVCLSSPNTVFIAKGTNPTATANSLRIPANTMYHLSISPGQKIAAIQETTAGSLSITLLR